MRCRQSGVFRTNCIDCLDRTNVVQSMIARRTVDLALRDAGLVLPVGASEADAAECRACLARLWPGFEGAFKGVWADNADTCSVQYSGTPALKTDFTRTGMPRNAANNTTAITIITTTAAITTATNINTTNSFPTACLLPSCVLLY